MTVSRDPAYNLLVTKKMTRPEASRLYEARVLLFDRGYRLLVIEVVEVGSVWVSVMAQRVNRDGTIDARDDKPRPQAFRSSAILGYSELGTKVNPRRETP